MKINIMDSLQDASELRDRFILKEEYGALIHDQYDRFLYSLSRYRDVFVPSVSEFLFQNGYNPEYPGGTQFAVCLTHDVDTVYKSAFIKGYSALKSLYRKDRSSARAHFATLASKKKPFCNFDLIMDLEEEYGATSSFFFLALTPEEMDFRYHIADLEDELHEIVERGWEVGLHGGHEAYSSYAKISDEKKRLESVLKKPVIGYRNHYLKFRVPDTWELLARAGFSYDTTLSYPDCVGFRNGMCHPFRPYNLETKSEIDIIEIPLVVMDGTLFADYMRLDRKTAYTLVIQLIDTVAACHGVFTILWHNTYLLEGSQEMKMYEDILRYCDEKDAWMASGEEICHHF